MNIKENFAKGIVQWLWILFILSIASITYASLTTVSSGDTLTATAWNSLIWEVNNNSSKTWIIMLADPITVANSGNGVWWIASTTVDLNTISWITVPTWATHALVQWSCVSYTTANGWFSVTVDNQSACSENGNAAWNKNDTGFIIAELTGTSLTYTLSKYNTSGHTSFSVTWFIVQ